jgi:TRAP-type C4-dicarboxylate transport system substrate-binding protein
MTGHFHGIALVLCNTRSWANWPEEVRSALSVALSESTAAQWKFASDEEVSARSALKTQGISIIDLDESARAAFKQAVRTVIEQGCSGLPQELSDLLRDAGTRGVT